MTFVNNKVLYNVREHYGLNYVVPPPTNLYIKALIPSVTVVGDRAYRDAIKVKCLMGGSLSR